MYRQLTSRFGLTLLYDPPMHLSHTEQLSPPPEGNDTATELTTKSSQESIVRLITRELRDGQYCLLVAVPFVRL